MRSDGIAALAMLLSVTACGTKERILTHNVVDPKAIIALTKFRSCCGHTYAGGAESNRSMKHYLVPNVSFGFDDHTLPVYAPCDGEIIAIVPESPVECLGGSPRGFQVKIVPRARPDVHVRLFHVNPTRGAGTVRSGERIGFADLRTCANGSYRSFDVSIEKAGPRYSYMEWLDDGAFAAWAARGLASRDDAVVSRAARDADPCNFDDYRQCDGDTISFPLPSPPSAIAAGAAHTCSVMDQGSIQCWGHNFAGQLGNGSTTDSSTPMEVVGLTAGVQGVAPGSEHTCALVNGGAWCWGNDAHGELGDGSTLSSAVPVEVSGLSTGITGIAAGRGFTCALVNGGAQCWGDNTYGELGDGSTAGSFTPVPVDGLGSGVQAIAASGHFACAVVNGGARCWGYNRNGQLGDGSTAERHAPVQVDGLATGVEAIAAGLDHACALVNGGVQCWGDNSWGQLGNDSTVASSVPVPVVGLASGVQAIAAGGWHTCALVSGGVQCWGRGDHGQLGDGNTAESHTPVPVFDLTSGAKAIAAGQSHTCALVKGGAMCWGDQGRLGDVAGVSSAVPIAVFGLAP